MLLWWCCLDILIIALHTHRKLVLQQLYASTSTTSTTGGFCWSKSYIAHIPLLMAAGAFGLRKALSLQCFDTVGLATGRDPACKKN